MEKINKLNNTKAKFILNCNVPQQFFEDLTEWYDDCKAIHNDNRWKKIWHDHVYVKDLKGLLINLQVELKEANSILKDLEQELKQKRQGETKFPGLMK